MKIKVISLRDSADRRASITRQFAQLGTPFEFFDAITPGNALAHVTRYDKREFLHNCGRYATKPEIACYASHLALWRECAAGQSPFLILEDDAYLRPTFAEGILVTASQIDRRGILRVSSPTLKSSVAVGQLGPFEIRYCRRVPLLALGYAVSPQVASRLADAAKIVEEPVDKFLQRFWRHGQPVFAVTPAFVDLGPLAENSDIGARIRPSARPSNWVQRAARKTRNAVQRTIFNINFLSELRA